MLLLALNLVNFLQLNLALILCLQISDLLLVNL